MFLTMYVLLLQHCLSIDLDDYDDVLKRAHDIGVEKVNNSFANYNNYFVFS